METLTDFVNNKFIFDLVGIIIFAPVMILYAIITFESKSMKQNVMRIHTTTGSTIVTPFNFAMKSRCKRLKAELKSNTNTGFKRWGKI